MNYSTPNSNYSNDSSPKGYLNVSDNKVLKARNLGITVKEEVLRKFLEDQELKITKISLFKNDKCNTISYLIFIRRVNWGRFY